MMQPRDKKGTQAVHAVTCLRRHMLTAALASLVALSAVRGYSASAQASEMQSSDTGSLQGSQYLYRGYRFDLRELGSAAKQQAMLQALRRQADIVEKTALSADTKRFLQSFTIHVSQGQGEHGGGGHFNREGVFVSLMPKPDERPILLHEFMHAYHNARLPEGRQNPQVLLFFNRARQGGMWPAGSYMLSNVGEFFAMTASTYLYGHAARPPFTREAIEQKQPYYAEWLSKNLQ